MGSSCSFASMTTTRPERGPGSRRSIRGGAPPEPDTQTTEFSVRDPDGYDVTISAPSPP